MEKLSGSPSKKQLEEKINQLERRFQREKKARQQAETILESKSLELYGSNKSLAFVNKKLELQLDRNKQFLQAINDFTGELLGKTNLNEIAGIITERLISKYDLEDCVIYKVDNGYCHQISAFGPKRPSVNLISEPMTIKVGTGIVGAVAKSGKAELIGDTSLDQRYLVDDQSRLSELTVPIIFEGEVIGIIDSEHSQKNFFKSDHLKTISTISNLVTVIFKNSLTEEKNLDLESNIQQRTEIINSLVENLHSGLLINDHNGKIILVNDVFRKTFKVNIPDSDLIGKDQRASAEMVKDLFKEPQSFIDIVDYCHVNNKDVSRKELELKDGTILECDFIPIYSNRTFIGQMWQIHDVTAMSLSRKKLEISEEKYRGIIENMELGLLEVDPDHKVLRAYEWFCRMTGYQEEELIGKNAKELFLPEDYIDLMDEQDAVRAKGEQSIYEVQMKKKNGELIWVLISGAPFYDQDGQVAGTIGIHYNIDSRKKLEEELRKSQKQTAKAREAEKQFLANMSHEIRNPLNAIIGITNLLYDTKPTTEQLNHLNKIKHSSDILLGLISGILDISKIESGTLQLVEKHVDISEVVDGLIQIAGFNKEEKKIEYNNNLSGKGGFEVMADPTAINQIFLNLLNNATKFTEVGSISVQGSVLETSNGHTNFEFRVIDTGIGIDQDRLGAVFNIFEQADHETKLKFGGSGLGLNIVKQLVNMYEGTIRAESKLNQGTSIVFNLRLKAANKESPKIEKVQYQSTTGSRVLIVEDNEINQYYLSGILSGWDIAHDMANDGYEALDCLERQSYDLILMDIRMPGLDGYETTIKLRAMRQNMNADTPIIALTASALVDEREKALDAGMNFHLTKPYTIEDLGNAMAAFGIIAEVSIDAKDDFKYSSDLDVEYLQNFYQNDIKRAQTMFKTFLRVIERDLTELKNTLELEDWDAFSSVAHKIKPSFSMVGLENLFITMEYFEQANLNHDIREIIISNFSKFESDYKSGSTLVKLELSRMDKYLTK